MKYQFENALRPWLRDVLVHTSFIETAVREESDPNYKIQFGPSMGRLKLLKEKCGLYSDGKLDEIKKLWELRNDLIHKIVKNRFDEETIISKIHEMHDLIKTIYSESSFVRKYLGTYWREPSTVEQASLQGEET